MAYLTDYQYYNNEDNDPNNKNWGSYQYVSLENIVNNFELIYKGNEELINNTERYKVIFHAKRAIQELNYDALKETKIVELSVSDTSLRVILPPDYVNLIRLSLYEDGVLRPLTENKQTNYAESYLQDNNYNVLFDSNGNVLKGTSTLDYDRITGTQKTMYLGDSEMNGREGFFFEGSWYFDYHVGSRYGLNTSTANINPTYKIDKASGVINFSSQMSDATIVLEYVSDGMQGGDDSIVSVNKLFEEYIYAYIKYAILNSKFGVQEYIVNRARKDKRALYRNAKIRMSNLHPSKLLQTLRGRDKAIK